MQFCLTYNFMVSISIPHSPLHRLWPPSLLTGQKGKKFQGSPGRLWNARKFAFPSASLDANFISTALHAKGHTQCPPYHTFLSLLKLLSHGQYLSLKKLTSAVCFYGTTLPPDFLPTLRRKRQSYFHACVLHKLHPKLQLFQTVVMKYPIVCCVRT